MADALTARAKTLLNQQNNALLIDDTVFTTQVETVKHILQWCEQEDINPGKWLVQNKRYRFTREGIDKIHEAYSSSMLEDIFADFSQDNHQTAAAKSADEKQGQIKPTHHLILAALTKHTCFEHFQHEFYHCKQVNVELDMGELDFSAYDALLMIENRDSFNDWHVFQTQVQPNLGKVLAIYRGDSVYSVAAANLLQRWRASRPDSPVIYFGDFDLAGLRIAVANQCAYLLLPEIQWLEQHVISQHYPEGQEKFLLGLERDCPQRWQVLLQMMRDKRAGLRQQKMYDTPLFTYSIDTL